MFMRRVRRFSGQPFLCWVIGYGILRPIIEAFRDDRQRGSVGALSTSQFIGLTSVVLGIGLLVYLVRKHRQDPTGMRLWELPVEPAAEAPAPARAQRRRKGR
jgi:phosphatidylglycerol---prolipoprotein diacylglyceryl transferase